MTTERGCWTMRLKAAVRFFIFSMGMFMVFSVMMANPDGRFPWRLAIGLSVGYVALNYVGVWAFKGWLT